MSDDRPSWPEPAIPPGSQVRLVTGGPAMTVKDGVAGLDLVTCQWFTGGHLHEAEFAPEGLEVVAPPRGGGRDPAAAAEPAASGTGGEQAGGAVD